MTKESPLAISIVTFRCDLGLLTGCLESIGAIRLPFTCMIIDNASDPGTRTCCLDLAARLPSWGRLEYRPNVNSGYGRAHNIALDRSLESPACRYHIVMNPDIAFAAGTIERLVDFLDQTPRAGAVMPRVLYPDGSLQYLCKLLPSPGHLAARRFWPALAAARDAVYTLRHADYDEVFECPSLSGCFMMLRTDALRRAGLFDERFFLYFEDVDLIRRIGQHYKTLYCPLAQVTHDYQKGSYSSFKLLRYHIASTLKYFGKWGWLNDPGRSRANQQALQSLPVKSKVRDLETI